MKISIVIPNYNGEELLVKNLPKLINFTSFYSNCEIIVVDDYSSDNSLEVLKKFNVKVIKNQKNLGFASTVNKGVASASEAKSEIIVLLNSDVYPENDILSNLEKYFNNEETFAVGFMDKSVEGKNIVQRGRGLGYWHKGFLIHRRGEPNAKDTLWVSGGSSAFKKSIWEKLGGLNEAYSPFYWEDIDVSYRALKSGFKIIFDNKRVVIHEHEKGAIKTKYSEDKINSIAYRNQYIFTWLNADFVNVCLNIIWAPYYLVKAIIRLDLSFVKGFLNFIFLIPKLLLIRSRQAKLFIKKDREIIQELG